MDTRQQTVLVGFDGSPAAEEALIWASNYAVTTGARLRLVSAWDWPTFQGSPIVYGDYDPPKIARQRLRAVAASCGVPRDRIDTVVTRGSAAHILVEEAKTADLLVVGSRGVGGFSRLVLGSVSGSCVHHSPCPVAVIRTKSVHHRGAGVVVGMDDSAYSRDALHWAMDYVALHGDPLTVVTVVEAAPPWLPTHYAVPGTHTPGGATTDVSLWLEELVAKELALRPAPLPHEPHRLVLEGDPAALLVDLSAEAALAVVGSHGSRAFRRAMLGSVSTAMALHADCSVVVVRDRTAHETSS